MIKKNNKLIKQPYRRIGSVESFKNLGKLKGLPMSPPRKLEFVDDRNILLDGKLFTLRHIVSDAGLAVSLAEGLKPKYDVYITYSSSLYHDDSSDIYIYIRPQPKQSSLFRKNIKPKYRKLTKRREGFWGDADIISMYTRAQAIEDGALVDVSEMADEAGIKYPTAVTRSLWGYIKPEGRKDVDWRGRLWSVLFLFTMYAKQTRAGQNRFRYKCKLGSRTPTLIAHVGGGDNGEPVITIMLPEDD